MSLNRDQLEKAQAGDPLAQCCVGWAYYHGEGVRKSFRQAVSWYRKAAKGGNRIAQYNLSLCYLDGEGVRKNLRTAFRWNQIAANAGHTHAEQMAGWYYYGGRGVKVDLAKARRWYLKAAAKGDLSAMFSLGQMAFDQKNFKEAARWFSKAGKKDHPRSNQYLGRMLIHGYGVPIDPFRARVCLKKAVAGGLGFANRLLNGRKLKRLLVKETNVAVNGWRRGSLLPEVQSELHEN